MLGWLILLFVAVPVFDLWLLFRIGTVLSFAPTLALVIGTGVAGAALARRQGLRTLARINAELAAGRMPAGELAEGLMILLAGAVLITPGFLTDVFGLILLVPACRRLFLKALTRYFESRIAIHQARFRPFGGAGSTPGGAGDRTDDPFGTAGPSPFQPNPDFDRDSEPRPMKHVRNEALDD